MGYSREEGCYLQLRPDIRVTEKVYGEPAEKLDKVMRSYSQFGRSLGVILSGEKGLGKSLFARLLAERAVRDGYPVILIDACYPGLTRFLESIETECVILFDEFDKIFRYDEDERDEQASLLSMFDGTGGTKKLYVVTCNYLYDMNSYLINRPGRFHYHLRFRYPSQDDVRAYLTDQLREEMYPEIEKVVDFSRRVSLNYDCLRAIAFEMNNGLPFRDAIGDLNILVTDRETFDVYLYCEGGGSLYKMKYETNLYERDGTMGYIKLNDDSGQVVLGAYYDKGMVQYDFHRGETIITADGIRLDYSANSDEDTVSQYLKKKPLYMTFRKKQQQNLHYVV